MQFKSDECMHGDSDFVARLLKAADGVSLAQIPATIARIRLIFKIDQMLFRFFHIINADPSSFFVISRLNPLRR
jgi:hypothetical protein